jgi:hypothetical protein
MAGPGETARSPVSVVAPVFVTVEAPRTENAAGSVPRIPSALASGTEKDKIAKGRIRKEKTQKLPYFTHFANTSLAGMMDQTSQKSVQLEAVCVPY